MGIASICSEQIYLSLVNYRAPPVALIVEQPSAGQFSASGRALAMALNRATRQELKLFVFVVLQLFLYVIRYPRTRLFGVV